MYYLVVQPAFSELLWVRMVPKMIVGIHVIGFFTGWMSIWSPCHQHQSTEGSSLHNCALADFFLWWKYRQHSIHYNVFVISFHLPVNIFWQMYCIWIVLYIFLTCIMHCVVGRNAIYSVTGYRSFCAYFVESGVQLKLDIHKYFVEFLSVFCVSSSFRQAKMPFYIFSVACLVVFVYMTCSFMCICMFQPYHSISRNCKSPLLTHTEHI